MNIDDMQIQELINEYNHLSDVLIVINYILEKMGKETLPIRKITPEGVLYEVKYKKEPEKNEKVENMAIEVKKNYNINDMILEKIDDKFGWIVFGNVKVIVILENGYINATKLCKLGNKSYKNWLQNSSSNELIKDIENDLNSIGLNSSQCEKATILVRGGRNDLIRGTYVHSEIAIQVACWISTKFARMVSKIVMNYLAEQCTIKLKQEIIEKDNKISTLENKLDTVIEQNIELMKENKKQTETINGLVNINLDQTQKIDKQSEDIKDLLGYGRGTFNTIKQIHENIPGLGKKSAQAIHIHDAPELIIISNYEGYIYGKNGDDYPFSTIRRSNNSIESALKKHKERYPNYRIIRSFDTPSPVITNRNFIQTSDKISSYYNTHFYINYPFTLNEVLDDLERMNRESTTDIKKINQLISVYV